jgi:Tfp pilus assembly protein PilE
MTKVSNKAFTLHEMLIYIGILATFLTAVFATFNLSITYFHMTQAKSDSLQSSQVAVDSINRTLATGASSTLMTQTTPTPACRFLSAQPGTSSWAFQSDPTTGAPVWQKWMCYYVDSANGRLMFSELAITPSSTIPTAPSFSTMTALPSRVISRNVASATFAISTVDGVTRLTYSISSSAQPSIANGRRAGVTLDSYFAMRN